MKNGTACFLRNYGGAPESPNRSLFLYRHDGEKDLHNGYYVFPGGTIERGETGIDCIVREFKEETGLNIIKPRLKVLWTCDNRERLLGGRTDREDWLVQMYIADKFYGELREEVRKNAKPIWISDDSLDKIKMYPGDRELLELLGKGGIFEVRQRYQGEELVLFDWNRVD